MKIYIVCGMTGEYSDSFDWNVCAYTDKNIAEEHARKAMLRGKEIQKSNQRYYRPKHGENQFDVEMSMDYTGTEYTVNEVDLLDSEADYIKQAEASIELL